MDENVPKPEVEDAGAKETERESLLGDYTAFQKWEYDNIFYAECKRFLKNTEVTPHDVRDFLGTIKDIDHPAEMGYLITTNKFTLAAKKAAEREPRIELIDAIRLVEYYKMAQGKMPTEPHIPEPQAPAPQANIKNCPRCGENLALRTAHKGEHAGHQFWGCSNYPKCTYLENIQENAAVH